MPSTAKLLDDLAGALAAAYADDADDEARTAAAAALDALIEERGWSTRALGRSLGTGTNGSLVAGWRRGARLPPPWLALALAAVDAGDRSVARLDAAALRERMASGGWLAAALGAVLGVGRVAVIRWRRGRATPPRGLAMAIGEAERRTPRADRRALPDRDHAVGARRAFEEALRAAHTLDRRLRAARYHGEPSATIAEAAGRAAVARTAAAEALGGAAAAAGWSDRGLTFALGFEGHGAITSWRRGDRLPPPWLALALAALDVDDEPGTRLDAAALRAWMAAGGWSTPGLAAALGVAQAAVVRWRAGRTSPSRTVTLALSEAERRVPRPARA